MTGGTLALGVTFAALCILLGGMTCWPVAYRRGLKHAAEDAENTRDAAVVASWKDLPDEDTRPAPPWPAAPPQQQAPRDGPGKHRHPAGPPRHAPRPPAPQEPHPALPVAGYLPAPGPWDGTITVRAYGQAPPWETPPPPPPPEPQTQVLEPTPADCRRPDTMTDTGWTRQMARQLAQEMDADIERMAQETDAWIAAHVTATDPVLKEITR